MKKYFKFINPFIISNIFSIVLIFSMLLYYSFNVINILETTNARYNTKTVFHYLSFIFTILFTSNLFAIFFYSFFNFILAQTKNSKNILKKINDFFLIIYADIFTIFFIVDLSIYKIMGMHLTSHFVWDNLKKTNIQNEIHINVKTAFSIILFLIAVILINFLLFKLISKLIKNKSSKFKTIALIFITIFYFISTIFASYENKNIRKIINRNTALSQTLPLYEIFYDRVESSVPAHLNYPKIPKQTPIFKKKKDILYIQVESFRSDIFNSEITPNMVNFSQTHTCIHSKKHFSGELSTVYGTFSNLYSLNIFHYWPMANKKIKSFPLQLLKKNGYTLYGGAASNLRGWERKIDFMLNNFDEYKEFKAKNYQRDYDLVSWIIKKYNSRDKSKPAFFFAFFNATHHNYFYPKKFEKFKPAINQDFNYFGGDSVKKYKNQIFNRYKNSAIFVDFLFKNLITAFKKEIDNNNLIVVVTGDHGEEFFDEGKLGHGKISNNPRSKVPLLLCLPEIESKTVDISSHVDILPTIIDYLEPTPKISPSFYSNGISLLKKENPKRYIVVCGFDFPRRSREVTLINNYGKLLLKKTTDQINVTNEFFISKKMDLNDKTINETTPTPNLDYMKDKFEKDILKFYQH